MYKGKKVSLILPAYNEEDSIAIVINDFYKQKVVDEIVVVDNNSKDKTFTYAKETKKAKVVKEQRQGYGFALWKGLATAKGDILITCDADQTYVASDVLKLLKKSNTADFVWATRVIKPEWSKGSNMGILRRYANIFISRILQILFLSKTTLTDLGSTFRLLNRNPYLAIKKEFKEGGGHFQPELTTLALLHGYKIVETPVYYKARVGESKISGSFLNGVKTAKDMMVLILKKRIETLTNTHND